MSELSLWILAAVAAAIFGALVACLFMQSRTIGVQMQLTATESQLNEKNKRLETLEPEYQKSMEAKARAEQEAKRVPDLEKELKQATTDNTNLATEVAELKKAQEADKEKIQWAENAKQHLREAFQALASEALQSNAKSFLTNACQQLDTVLTAVRGDWTTQKLQMDGLVAPLKQNLTNLDGQIRLLEQKREGAYQSLEEQLRQLGLSHQQLQTTTVKLEQALKSPTVRGSWGQMQLRRVVEMAGMVPHVTFAEQVTIEASRPDLIVYLPNQAVLPVDAKAPMQAFFEAMESDDGEVRKTKLHAHAEAVRFRVRELSQKKYWEKFERAPEFVVMFVPNDTCLSAAFEHDPKLLEFAF